MTYATPDEWRAKAAEVGVGVKTLQNFLDDSGWFQHRTLVKIAAYLNS
jgi:hypothetical protein